MPDSPVLEGVIVVELGERIAVGACGSLLAQLGAKVVLVERPDAPARADGKSESRASFAAGKLAITLDGGAAADLVLLSKLVAAADIVLLSSDLEDDFSALARAAAGPAQIVCDLTAFGADGPLAGWAASDLFVQAMTGLMDTTGFTDGPPQGVPAPILEFAAAIYGAAACVAALRHRRRGGGGQAVDVALYDCAVSMLTTFLATYYGGGQATRVGNRHPLVAPWNAYRARDGWVLICSTSDAQWHRLCGLMDRPDLIEDPTLRTVSDRVAQVARVDGAVQDWVGSVGVDECVQRLTAGAVACGPILPAADVAKDHNLRYRGMAVDLVDPSSGAPVTVPGTPLRGSAGLASSATHIPAPDADRDAVCELLKTSRPGADQVSGGAVGLPLGGIKVIEIGHYTTAPLAARQLAALGAEVIKVEPPSGEGSRYWPPHKDGQGYFFTLGNNDKRAIVLDLRREECRDVLARLLAGADVLIENLRPGALARQGFSVERLAAINPRLIYCGVSGFGADSLHKDRPAYDTVVQAMSGIMDLVGAGGTPVKTGVSLCDLIGGEIALLAILAALEARETSGRGQVLDLSMQDAAAWITQTFWNGARKPRPAGFVRASDGLVAVGPEDSVRAASFADDPGLADNSGLDRAALVALLSAKGISAAPVLTVNETATHPHTLARRLLVPGVNRDGVEWPIMVSPMRLAKTPTRVRTPIGGLGADMEDVLAEVGYSRAEAGALRDRLLDGGAPEA